MNAGYLLLIGAPDDLQGDIVLTLGLPIPENFAVLFRGEGIRAYGSGIEVNALAGNAGIVLGSCEMTHVPASAFDGSASAAAQVTEIFRSRPSTWCKFGCGQRAALSGGLGCNL